jgi:CubicO group peptidase (beta-lactamase class C family)
MRPRLAVLALALLVLVPGHAARASSLVFVVFEQYLESLRRQAGIPGLSAAIVTSEQIVWERGLGFQNVESGLRAMPDTPYHIGGLTQIFTATLLLRCVEEGRLQLDDPIGRFTIDVPDGNATIRQLLSHTTPGPDGPVFRHDPARVQGLTAAVDACTARPYRQALARAVLDRFAMHGSVPGQDVLSLPETTPPLFEPDVLERYATVLARLARPYRLDRRSRANPSEPPAGGLTAGSGLISTVRDLARFDLALSDGALLREETLALAWSLRTTEDGRTLQHGLGWFVQNHQGQLVIWQFGISTDAYSSLVVKLPQRELTLYLLANSDALNTPFPLALGDVNASLFARIFLRLFG